MATGSNNAEQIEHNLDRADRSEIGIDFGRAARSALSLSLLRRAQTRMRGQMIGSQHTRRANTAKNARLFSCPACLLLRAPANSWKL